MENGDLKKGFQLKMTNNSRQDMKPSMASVYGENVQVPQVIIITYPCIF